MTLEAEQRNCIFQADDNPMEAQRQNHRSDQELLTSGHRHILIYSSKDQKIFFFNTSDDYIDAYNPELSRYLQLPDCCDDESMQLFPPYASDPGFEENYERRQAAITAGTCIAGDMQRLTIATTVAVQGEEPTRSKIPASLSPPPPRPC